MATSLSEPEPVGPLVQLSLPGAETDPAALPFRMVTLGCKVNQYESEFVRELLLANGYRPADPGEAARLAIVNTCTVTAESDSKSRQAVRQIARRNPGVQIVVMGCSATNDPESARRLPGVAAVVTDKRDLAGALRPFGVRRTIRGIRGFDGRSRVFVKAQDGCILDCSYCVIPHVRPGLRSRSIDDVVDECQTLVDRGYRELVLTGIHLGHYGIDLSVDRPKADWRRLWHLLERLSGLEGRYRIRLSSLEATEVTEDFVRVLADHRERICPHLHLSLQSGSDRVLAAMRRRYRVATFLDRCDRLRRRLDDPTFTTDVIVGFPGETQDDFQATIDLVRKVGFAKIHIFPFSARRGTLAATMPNPVAPSAIADRRRALAEVERSLALAAYERLVGRTLELLVEARDDAREGWARGTTCRYAPAWVAAPPSAVGELLAVRVTGAHQDGVDAKVVAPATDLASSTGDRG